MNKKNAFFKVIWVDMGKMNKTKWMALTSEWTVQSSGLGNKKIEQQKLITQSENSLFSQSKNLGVIWIP